MIDLFSVVVPTDVSQVDSVPDGMFRKPSQGQSLISYLSEQDFGSCADLEKVRVHFQHGTNSNYFWC